MRGESESLYGLEKIGHEREREREREKHIQKKINNPK